MNCKNKHNNKTVMNPIADPPVKNQTATPVTQAKWNATILNNKLDIIAP